MKIRVVLADSDKKYIAHFTKAMQAFYCDSIELVSFSKEESLQEYVGSNSYDILLKTMDFPDATANRDKTVYLTELSGVREENGEKVIGKYQRIDKIYMDIVNAFSEIKTDIKMSSVVSTAESTFVGFTSTAGGTGKTTMAISYARKLVEKGYQVLYLSLESFSTINTLFDVKGDTSFSNVIFALKSKKGNIQLKLEGSLRQIYGGIYYLAVPDSPYEIPSVNKDEWEELFETVRNMGRYHYIVIDLPDIMNGLTKELLELLDRVVITSDATDNVVQKNQSMYDYLKQSKNSGNIDFARFVVVQNKSSDNRRDMGIPVVAEIPFISNAIGMGVVDRILADQSSDELLNIYNPGGAN